LQFKSEYVFNHTLFATSCYDRVDRFVIHSEVEIKNMGITVTNLQRVNYT